MNFPLKQLLNLFLQVTRFRDGKLFVDTRGTGVGLLEVIKQYESSSLALVVHALQLKCVNFEKNRLTVFRSVIV